MANRNPTIRQARSPVADTADDYFTIPEVAQLYKVSEGVVRRMILKKELKGFKMGNQWRISRTELREYERNSDWGV